MCYKDVPLFLMQAFIVETFNQTTSISAALQLSCHLKTVLQRDSLKAHLTNIYEV